jgi:HD-GYP domain-containing protein (c-di-GMP phosphodiesterase class II)
VAAAAARADTNRPTPGAARDAVTGADRPDATRNPHRNESGTDAIVRKAGRAFIQGFYAAVRAIRLYPVENVAVQRALQDLTATTGDLLRAEGELEFRTSGEFIFINATRLRLDIDNYTSFSHLLSLFRACGIGALRVHAPAEPRDWLVLISQLLALSAGSGDPEERYFQLQGKLEQAKVSAFEAAPPAAQDDGESEREQIKEAAKRTYAQSVAVTKEVMASVRLGRALNVKKLKRVVQGIVDQILNEETSLMGLTTLRDYDEYTFTHSVNVCIFSVALGRRLGLTKLQLYDLGLAALFHDIGKSRVPVDILNKSDGLSESEWRAISMHPWQGVLTLFQVRGVQDLPFRSMVVAYEHHMKTDLLGYPRPVRPRTLGIYSKIVSVADGFDAATSRRAYCTDPMSPAAALKEMRDNPKRGMDMVVVKGFINLLGIYPVGTLVVLDTFELAIVHSANPNPTMLSRPVVRIVSDQKGNILFPGELANLAEQTPAGVYERTIIKTADPDRYGIRVSDYFV